jgi:hypothetical protein
METHLSEGVDMSKVAFLGLGAMGSRMAANLLGTNAEQTPSDRCVTKGILFGGFPFVLTSWE